MALSAQAVDEPDAETTCRCGSRIVRCRGVRTSWMHVPSRDEECWDGGWANPAGHPRPLFGGVL